MWSGEGEKGGERNTCDFGSGNAVYTVNDDAYTVMLVVVKDDTRFSSKGEGCGRICSLAQHSCTDTSYINGEVRFGRQTDEQGPGIHGWQAKSRCRQKGSPNKSCPSLAGQRPKSDALPASLTMGQ